MTRRRNWVLGAMFGITVAAVVCPLFAQDTEPGKQELTAAEHYLVKFEQLVDRANGQAISPGHDGKEALERVAALHKAYPDHPKVMELFERTRKALLLSKGDAMEITPDMLTYRENEKKLQAIFLEQAETAWAAYLADLEVSGEKLEKAFPPPNWREVDMEEMIGKRVVLEDFEYPTNEFSDAGRQFVFVGKPSRGFYFVELSNRAWPGAYEAVKRYRRFINSDVPEGMKWTLVGRITGLELLVPQAGEEKTFAAQWGWRVEPEAIWVPGRTFAIVDDDSEDGGHYAGETNAEALKQDLYTVTSIPDDVTPERLTEIFATAIKEKNFPLYMDCIDPDRRVTPKGRSLCMYHWEWHQYRFSEFYCHIVVGEADTYTIKGFDPDDQSVEDVFLTDEDKAAISEYAEPLLKHGELKTTAYDERGRQYGSPKPRFFKKEEDGRWYITNYAQPF